MLRSYLHMAFRRLWKNRAFTFINVVSLAVGLSGALVIISYIREELSYDKFHERSESIYRVTEEYWDDAQAVHMAMNHGPMADVINGRLKGLKRTVRILPWPAYVTPDNINKHRESRLLFVDSTFFKVFSFKSKAGDLERSMISPFSVVITESTAQKYFGKTDVVGKALQYEDESDAYTYYITAVVEDVPQPSHFKFDLVFNMASLPKVMHWYNSWHYPPMYLYIEMEGEASITSLQNQIQTLAAKHQPDEVKTEKRKYFVQLLEDIHLNSSLYYEWEANSDIDYVKLFGGISIFLVLIACVNFINLSTAQAAQRAREVGVRKVLGAFQKQLIIQFLGEAFLIALISLTFALGAAELLLVTLFKFLLEKNLSLAFIFQNLNWLWMILFLFMIAMLTGLYPSFYLSRFKAILTLKGQTEPSGSTLGLRRGLVLFQFIISGLLIIGTVIVLRQVNLLRNKNLGFDKDQLVAIKMVDDYSNQNYLQLKHSLESDSRVTASAISSEIPGGNRFHGFEINPEGFESGSMSMKTLGVDEDFLPAYGLKILTGRNFSSEILTDDNEAIILNESAVKFLGWDSDVAIGKEFELILYTDGRVARKGTVIGVVSDFHFESLHHKISPLVMYINKHPYYCDYLTVRLKPGEIEEHVKLITEKWNEFNPEKPVEYYFMDDRLAQMYYAETRISSVLTAFTILSIIISCLGLFGLSIHAVMRRTKEIGIRKVLGASVTQLASLLSREFVVLIFMANLLAWPLAFYISSMWLQHFPYRIALGIDILLYTTGITLLIAILTVSIQSVRAALANPVESLRTE